MRSPKGFTLYGLDSLFAKEESAGWLHDFSPNQTIWCKFSERLLCVYTNTIEHQGDITNVTTTAKLTVSVLGMKVHRQDISRRETWQGNRIVDFRSVTTENGKMAKLKAAREPLRERLSNFLTPDRLSKWDAEVAKAKSFLGYSS